jgi:hypothetical protein
MDKERDEGIEKRSKVTVKEAVTKRTGGTKKTEGSDKVDGRTHFTVKKTTSEGEI